MISQMQITSVSETLLSLATVLLMSLANKNIRLICAICGRLNNNFLVQFTFQKHLRARAQFLIGKRLVRLGTHVNIKLKHTTNKYKTKIPHNYLSYTGFLYLFQEFTSISSRVNAIISQLIFFTRVNDLEMSRRSRGEVGEIVKEK